MTEPNPTNSPPQVLSYAAERRYRPRNTFSPESIVRMVLAAGLAACVGAAVVVATVWVADFRLVFVAVLCQAIVIDVLFRQKGLRWAKIRSKTWGVIGAVFCAALSMTLVWYGVYVHSAFALRDNTRRRVANAGTNDFEAIVYRSYLRSYDAHPLQLYDRLHLIPLVHRGGFAGFLISLNRPQEHVVAIGYALLLLFPTGLAAWKARPHIYCDNCGAWCRPPRNVAVAPIGMGPYLAKGIETADCDAIVRFLKAVPDDLGRACSVVRLHSCSSCEQTFADVVPSAFGKANAQRVFLEPYRVSAEMITALKTDPDPPISVPAETNPESPMDQ